MTDRTTMGITAEPEEVEAVLNNLCGYHLAERDPVFRYAVLTREQVLYDALVAAIKRERGRALAELVASGHKMTEVAELTGLGTRQRVQRLMQLAKVAELAAAEVQSASREVASRDFDERLAAVHATLDEVVSGLTPTAVNEVAAVVNEPATPNVVAELSDDFAEVVAKDDQYAPEAFDDYEFSLAGMAEPTQVMPTLAAVLHPARELPAEEVPWWRRSRDTGAA